MTFEMKKRAMFAISAVLAFFLVWVAFRQVPGGTDGLSESADGKIRPHSIAGDPALPPVRTRSGERIAAASPPTHYPDQLPEFMLPDVTVDGLTLNEALQKLKAAYEEACQATGENPVTLRFVLPPGLDSKLHLSLGIRNVDSSIRLLGAVSGLRVVRVGSEYRFSVPEEKGGFKKLTIPSPPGLVSAVNALNGDTEPAATVNGLAESLSALGIVLDPPTKLSMFASGNLVIETSSAADAIAIAALVDVLGRDQPIQHKLQTKVIEIPAGTDWDPPDGSSMLPQQETALLRELAQHSGVHLDFMPSIMGRIGEESTIEIIRELITPVGNSSTEFETHKIGKVVHFHAEPLGFGHQLDFSFRDTIPDLLRTEGSPVADRTHITDSGFSGDTATRVYLEERADGSRTLLLVKPTLIDATGQPLRRE